LIDEKRLAVIPPVIKRLNTVLSNDRYGCDAGTIAQGMTRVRNAALPDMTQALVERDHATRWMRSQEISRKLEMTNVVTRHEVGVAQPHEPSGVGGRHKTGQ